ncbi:hypothetical protein Tco_0906407 [Tanacetum coccineum]|uniref:Uncharacterized protein n=1 Tax=Tanacetum coccineum TaxID=301880 RepID=A0ABQ5CJ43_9ASTR
MDLSAFIQVVDPTKVKVGERERAEGEAKLLDFAVGHVVLLLPVTPARAESELEASVDRLFDEGGSVDQGDSAGGGGQDAETELVTTVKIIDAENVIAERPRHPRKKRSFSGAATGGKSSSVLKELLASSILNVESDVEAVATLPLVTSFVSAMPERKSGAPTDSITGLNLGTIGPSERFVISSDSSHHSSTNAAEAGIDSFIKYVAPPPVMTKIVITTNIASIPSVPAPKTDTKCEKQADLLKAMDAEVESLKVELLLKETKAAEQRNVALKSEKNFVNGKVTELQSSVSAKDLELKDLNVVVSSLKSQNDGLVDQCMRWRLHMSIVNDKVAKLDADLLEMALHLEEKFYPHLLNTISARRWLLTHGVKLAVVKCLNSQEYLKALGSAISRAIEKGMLDGLSTGIDHEKAGRGLKDVVTYNPVAEANYNSAMQRLCEVYFLLLFELSSHMDASTVDIMNLLRLESPFADAPGMSDLQPDVEQLTLPIHQHEDQVVLSETYLSFALSVAHSRVERIRENVAAQRSALIDVWVPLVDLLSAQNLIGATSTSGSVPAAIVSTTALSTTFSSASSVPSITTDDYEIVNVDGQEDS